MTTKSPSLCAACARLRPGGLACEAYDRIPYAILTGAEHHDLRGDEDRPLTFVPLGGVAAAEALELWVTYSSQNLTPSNVRG